MLNRCIIGGRIGNEIELKALPNGTEVVNLSIACSRDFNNKDGKKDTDWIKVIAFKHNATYLNTYGNKGDMVTVDGKLQTRQWQTTNGENRYETEVVAERIYLHGSKSNSDANVVSLPKADNNDTDNQSFEAPETDDFVAISSAEEAELPF